MILRESAFVDVAFVLEKHIVPAKSGGCLLAVCTNMNMIVDVDGLFIPIAPPLKLTEAEPRSSRVAGQGGAAQM